MRHVISYPVLMSIRDNMCQIKFILVVKCDICIIFFVNCDSGFIFFENCEQNPPPPFVGLITVQNGHMYTMYQLHAPISKMGTQSVYSLTHSQDFGSFHSSRYPHYTRPLWVCAIEPGCRDPGFFSYEIAYFKWFGAYCFHIISHAPK